MIITSLAAQLQTARAGAKLLHEVSDDTVQSLDDAYHVQSELIRLAHGDVRGWKVTALTSADQKKFSSYRPVAGPLLGDYVHKSPAQVTISSLITPLLECEVAFV